MKAAITLTWNRIFIVEAENKKKLIKSLKSLRKHFQPYFTLKAYKVSK